MADLHPYARRPGHDSPARGGRQLVALAISVGLLLNFGPRLISALSDLGPEPSPVTVMGTARQAAG